MPNPVGTEPVSRPSLRAVARVLCAVALLTACGGKETPVPDNPIPVTTSIDPDTIIPSATPVVVTVTGSGFIAGSVIRFSGVEQPTTFVSSSQLRITITAEMQKSLGLRRVTVFNPLPGGGVSGERSLFVLNPVPTITSTAPLSKVLPAVAGDTITLTGTNFLPESVVDLEGAIGSVPDAVTPTTIKFRLTNITVARPYKVRVSNPAPGGGFSNAIDLDVKNDRPVITSLTPDLFEGRTERTVTVNGTGFRPFISATVNGAARGFTYVSATQGTLTLDLAEMATVGTLTLVAFNEAPTIGASAPFTIRINEAPASVTALSPASVSAGSGAVTLQLTGVRFKPASVVRWNGTPLVTTYVSASRLDAQVPASLLATAQVIPITVQNPGAGLVSAAASFPVTSAALTVGTPTVVSLAAADLEWVASRSRLYASVVSGTGANTVASIDPVTGSVTTLGSTGSRPAEMAATDDGAFLYVARATSPTIVRLDLATGATLLTIPVVADTVGSAITAEDLATIPGAPRVLVASLRTSASSPRAAGVVAFDDGVPRANAVDATRGINRIETASATTLYGFGNESSGFGLLRLILSPTGVSFTAGLDNAFPAFDAEMTFGGGRLVGSTGDVIDAATLTNVGVLPAAGGTGPRAVAVDGARGRVYAWRGGRVYAYDLSTLLPLGNADLDLGGETARRLIRWGSDGLAVMTDTRIVLVRGTLIGA